MIKLYTFILNLIYKTLLAVKRFLPQKIRQTLELRDHPYFVKKGTYSQKKPLIWFHAASGEIEYLRPILRKVRSDHPDANLFLTFFSVSALSWIHKVPEIDGWAPLPFDLPFLIKPFLKDLNPRCLIIARTDIWPNLVNQCALSQIPCFLVSATFSEGSRKTNWGVRFLLKKSLSQFKKIWVVSGLDYSMGLKVSPKAPFVIAGDTRYDQVTYRLSQNKPLPFQFTKSKTPILVFGSTWPEDEVELFEALKKVENHDFKIIWVPHESTENHLQLLLEKLSSLGLETQKLSQISGKNWTSQVLIIDSFGWLLDLYRVADLAFIGGSFKSQVHSVMEALGSGVPVFIGPNYLNNREAIEYSEIEVGSFKAVTVCENQEKIVSFLEKFFTLKDEDRQKSSELIKALFIKKTGSTELIYKELKKWL